MVSSRLSFSRHVYAPVAGSTNEQFCHSIEPERPPADRPNPQITTTSVVDNVCVT